MKDKVYHWIARNLPKSLVYWCGIVLWANATTGKWSNTLACSDSVTVENILDRWES